MFPDDLDASPRALLAAFTSALPGDLASAGLNLHITSGANLALDGITAQGALSVDLYLGGSWQDPRLVGSVSVKGGKMFLPDTELAVARGTLLFDETRPVDDPLFVVSATGTLSTDGETGNVYFSGSRSEGVSRTNTLDAGNAVTALLSADRAPTRPAVSPQGLFSPLAAAEAPIWPQASYLRLR